MDCVKIRKLLSAYMDRDLDRGTYQSVEMHLEKCEECREELLSLKDMIAELKSLDNLEAPEGFIRKVQEQIEHPSWSDTIRWALFFPEKIKLPLEFAALAVTALLVIFIFNGLQPDRPVSDILRGDGKTIIAMDSGKDNENAPPIFQEDEPVQLTILLEPTERHEPPSLKNVIPVMSGSRRGSPDQNGFGFDPVNPLFDQSMVISYQDDFLSDINMILTHVKGRLLSSEYEVNTGILQYIVLEIPAKNYRPFLNRLESIGLLQTPAPEMFEGQKDKVRIRIRVIL